MKQITPGISDSKFIRSKVPMTKEEVRAVSICKLRLEQNSVVYDIGSGTGSIAVEIARLSSKLKVFAIETTSEAVELIRQNVKKFELDNIQIVKTLAPEGLNELPPATHAFIGGTKGQFKEILSALIKINPKMRVVVNAVTLESISTIRSVLSDLQINYEYILMNVSRSESTGKYHLMKAENPVYIFSFNLNDVENA